MENLSEDRIIQDRIEKLEKIRELNIDPFPSRWESDRKYIADVIDTFTQNENSDIKEKSSSVSGRIIAKRGMGKVVFFDIKDQSGKIQLHYKEEESNVSKDFLDLLDIGDIVGVDGSAFRTRRGEITLDILKIVLLYGSAHPPTA